MLCIKCGKEVKDNSKFCPYCGFNIAAAETSPEKSSDNDKDSASVKSAGAGFIAGAASSVGAVSGMFGINKKKTIPEPEEQKVEPEQVVGQTSSVKEPVDKSKKRPKSIIDKVTNVASKGLELNSDIYSSVAEAQTNMFRKNGKNNKFYAAFSSGMKTFAFTDTGLEIGKYKYDYKDLSPVMMNAGSSVLTNGVAVTKDENGKEIALGFVKSQDVRFADALGYVNDAIDKAHGIVRNYAHVYYSPDGHKIEEYEDYIDIFTAKQNFASAMSTSAGQVFNFTEITTDVSFNDKNEIIFSINLQDQGTVSMRILEKDKEAIMSLSEKINSIDNVSFQGQDLGKWKVIVPEERKFTLKDEILVVSEEEDYYNSLRKVFRSYAKDSVKSAREMYDNRVHNLETFISFYVDIYKGYAAALTQRCIDVLVSEGVYSISQKAFSDSYFSDHHEGLDICDEVSEAIQAKTRASQETTAALTGLVPNLVGGGFGFKGAMKGIAEATVFNLVRDSVEDALLSEAGKLKKEQAEAIYSGIDVDDVFDKVFSDFFGLHLALAKALHDHGVKVWLPNYDDIDKAEATVENMTNPYFPDEQKDKVLVKVLTVDPYSENVVNYMKEHYGDSEEVNKLIAYRNA